MVEDSATERERLRFWLEDELGYRVQFAPDVASAEDHLAKDRPDCVLLDQVLPDGSGTELLISLRRRFSRSTLPVILMTGAGSEEIAVEALRHGAADYLVKRSLSTERLETAITHAVERAALERRIEAGTTELMRRNGELEQAHRQLATLQTERDTLYQMVVHDLRTPLGVIEGASCELEHLVGSADGRHMLRLLQRGTTRLEALVRALTQLVQGERTQLEMDEQSLAPLVDDVITEHEREAAQAKVRLQRVLDGSARALVDGAQLSRAVSNLISNGIRHARSEVTIVVRTDGPCVTLDVCDDGEGVPQELRDRLFHLCVRGERPGSFGLGLAIVRRIAEQHGGTARIADAAGTGACFRLELPGA